MYRLVPDGQSSEQIAALRQLPCPASRKRWTCSNLPRGSAGRPCNAEKPDCPIRELPFGPHGAGSITCLLLEDQREVHLLVVRWLGVTGVS